MVLARKIDFNVKFPSKLPSPTHSPGHTHNYLSTFSIVPGYSTCKYNQNIIIMNICLSPQYHTCTCAWYIIPQVCTNITVSIMF